MEASSSLPHRSIFATDGMIGTTMNPSTHSTTNAPESMARQENGFRHNDGHNPNDNNSNDPAEELGSTVAGAIFNFTNCVIGAGAIGLGGAFAASGGWISILTVILFGYLTKLSLDLVIGMSIELAIAASNTTPSSTNTNHQNNTKKLVSYEDLAYAAFGWFGQAIVAVSKFLYSFGCLVAYTVVIKDNLGPALQSLVLLLLKNHTSGTPTAVHALLQWLYQALGHPGWVTWTVSSTIILPLCLLRDMSPLAGLSCLSVACMMVIVAIVIYLYATLDLNHQDNLQIVIAATSDTYSVVSMKAETFYHHWVEVRPGYLRCLGTFVFTFVSQHTVHLTFGSLKPSLRTLYHWKQVSTASMTIATVVSLAVGLFVYMTFWQHAVSDIFQVYPSTPIIDLAKILLSITMLFTFPLPLFTCRELLVMMCSHASRTTTVRESISARGDTSMITGSGTVTTGPITTTNDDNRMDLEIAHGTKTTIHVTTADTVVKTITHSTELDQRSRRSNWPDGDMFESNHLTEPLLASYCDDGGSNVIGGSVMNITTTTNELHRSESAISTASSVFSTTSAVTAAMIETMMLPDHPHQLQWMYHVALTVKLWFVATALAVAAPSLGDVLDLVGCATGTVIAFCLPAAIAFQLQDQFHWTPVIILIVGGIVGIVGTYTSVRQFLVDLGVNMV